MRGKGREERVGVRGMGGGEGGGGGAPTFQPCTVWYIRVRRKTR